MWMGMRSSSCILKGAYLCQLLLDYAHHFKKKIEVEHAQMQVEKQDQNKSQFRPRSK